MILTGAVNEIGEPLTTNIPDSYRAGLELSAGVKICNGFRWDGNVTISQNKIKILPSMLMSTMPIGIGLEQKKIISKQQIFRIHQTPLQTAF